MHKIEAGATALLVDDDGVTRLLTQAALTEQGFIVTEADSGLAAFEAFKQCRPDVVLLDALMPGIDGFETCTQ
ncbi:MAG: response regulator, partial [Betaproteobacteria bacterium]|nr:response regulator [Betaproteobacteria bacterium]